MRWSGEWTLVLLMLWHCPYKRGVAVAMTDLAPSPSASQAWLRSRRPGHDHRRPRHAHFGRLGSHSDHDPAPTKQFRTSDFC
jgi:hypothetical protein